LTQTHELSGEGSELLTSINITRYPAFKIIYILQQALSFMHTPLEITFNGMDCSEFIERSIRKHLTRVEQHFHQLTSCYVSVSAPHKSRRRGNQFEIHIKAHVPGAELEPIE